MSATEQETSPAGWTQGQAGSRRRDRGQRNGHRQNGGPWADGGLQRLASRRSSRASPVEHFIADELVPAPPGRLLGHGAGQTIARVRVTVAPLRRNRGAPGRPQRECFSLPPWRAGEFRQRGGVCVRLVGARPAVWRRRLSSVHSAGPDPCRRPGRAKVRRGLSANAGFPDRPSGRSSSPSSTW